MAKEKTLYNVEIGSKGVFTIRSRQTNFDTLAEAKQYAGEQLAKGNAVAVNKIYSSGSSQTLAILGDINPKVCFSRIGKLKPLKQQIKAKGFFSNIPSDRDILKGVMD